MNHFIMFYIWHFGKNRLPNDWVKLEDYLLTLFFLHSVFESSFIWDGGSNVLAIFDRVTNSEDPSID